MRLPAFFRTAFITVLAASTLPAQRFEVGVTAALPRVSGTALGSLNTSDPKGDDSKLSKGKSAIGARFTLNTPGYYGHELGYLRTSTDFNTKIVENNTRVSYQDRIAIQQAFYNFMIYFMPAGERWRPFVTGGLQLQQYSIPSVPSWAAQTGRTYGGNWGGGLKLLLHKHALVRFDARDYIGGKPYDLQFDTSGATAFPGGGFFHQWEFSAGVSIAF